LESPQNQSQIERSGKFSKTVSKKDFEKDLVKSFEKNLPKTSHIPQYLIILGNVLTY